MKQKQLSMRWRRQDHKQQRQPNHYRKRHYRKTKWVHTKPRLYGGVLLYGNVRFQYEADIRCQIRYLLVEFTSI